ncbi:TPA: hypothetical protein DEB00_00445 [Candidatus Uhrbacteria bacterium]|nr:hypothetical protein [Candidatus Uhrbacteria bacterium]
MRIGIDFGTTNSAVAIVEADGLPQIVQLVEGEDTQRTVIHSVDRGVISYGNAALRTYMEDGFEGRFLRSLKSFLPHDVPRTTVGGQKYEFTELVAMYMRFLVESTEAVTGRMVDHVTIGRPVRFHADNRKEESAFARLQKAANMAGLTSYDFRLEPVAAAMRYELGLEQNRMILVGDFGGGTADFAILRVGPSYVGGYDRSQDVLAVSGVAKAGDALDARFMEAFLLDEFGRGSMIRRLDQKGEDVWNPSVLHSILRLYDVHRLRSHSLAEFLGRSEARMDEKYKVQRLRKLIFEDLGYPMAWAIEACKRALSATDETTFEFREFFVRDLDIRRRVTLVDYAMASQRMMIEYQNTIQQTLDRAGLGVNDIDEVFLTGGTSQLPFVRGVFEEMFGQERLREANAFTSVVEGLVLG